MTAHIVARSTGFSSAQLMHTIPEAARILCVGRSTVYVLMNKGSLRPVHIGRSIRISRAELERYVATLDREGQPTTTVDNLEPPRPVA